MIQPPPRRRLFAIGDIASLGFKATREENIDDDNDNDDNDNNEPTTALAPGTVVIKVSFLLILIFSFGRLDNSLDG